jgi:hypothetical protein
LVVDDLRLRGENVFLMVDIILKGEGDQRGGNDPARHHGNRDQGDRET